MNYKNNPLVSIIVITYNSSKYVLETLESALAQTYQNIELIVSDDCSSDNTLQVVDTWAESHKERFRRVEIVRAESNTGIPANCNRGLKAARGEWIKFIAGDDILLANCIDILVSFSMEKKSYISTSAIEEFCEDGSPVRFSKNVYLEQMRFFKKKNKEQFKSYIRNPVFLNSPALLFKKDLFERVGCFDESFRTLEDQPFLIKVLQAGYNIYYNEETTVRYRSSPKAAERIKGQEADNVLSFKLYRLPYLNKFNLFDLSVLYNFFLKNQIGKSKNAFETNIYKILHNLTDIIYIKNRVLNNIFKKQL